jgi:leucyl/phenylalanyl-tRNA---protein transferase
MGAAQMPDLRAWRRCVIGRTGSARSVADDIDRIGPQHRGALRGRNAGEEGLQHHEPCCNQDNGALPCVCGKCGWHVNLSHGTLAYLIFGNHPCRPEANRMANREFIEITPEVLLKAYACGIFPMAESAEDPALYWIEPEKRGVIPLDRFHMPTRLARTVRSDRFTITVNRDFDAVLEGCAEPRPGRPRTWINARIRVLYRKLYERRHCHSLEVYEGDSLVGGLYGVTLGRAFFGESMFHRVRDASKVALVHLVARLKTGGFKLLDTQFVTDHLRSFGAIEVPRRQYHKLLEAALTGEGDFAALGTKRPVTGAQVLAQLTTDRSSRG